MVSDWELRFQPSAYLWVLGFVSHGIDFLLPLHDFGLPFWTKILALPFFVLGMYLSIAGSGTFSRAGTTVDPIHPEDASKLVCHGLYGKTRNPIYLGFVSNLIFWTLMIGNPLPLIVCNITLVFCLTRFQIIPEERILEERFGEEYINYKSKVRRWL